MSFSLIISLLDIGSPTTIKGFIVPVDINSVNSSSHGSLPHILEKVLKRVKPPFAHSYSPSTVILVGAFLWLVTTFLHTLPATIFFALALSVSIVMYKLGIDITMNLKPPIVHLTESFRGMLFATVLNSADRCSRRSYYRNSKRITISDESMVVTATESSVYSQFDTFFNRAIHAGIL